MIDKYRLPVDIDEPKMIAFWEIPQFMFALMLFSLGIIVQSPALMLVLFIAGFKFLQLIKRLQNKGKRGEYLHKLWSTGVYENKLLNHVPFKIHDIAGR